MTEQIQREFENSKQLIRETKNASSYMSYRCILNNQSKAYRNTPVKDSDLGYMIQDLSPSLSPRKEKGGCKPPVYGDLERIQTSNLLSRN